MNNNVHFIITPHSITFSFEGQVMIFKEQLDRIKDLIKEERWDEIKKYNNLLTRIKEYGKEDVDIKNNNVYVDGEPLEDTLSKRIIAFMNEGLPFMPLINFIRKLRKNPSFDARKRLLGMLDQNHHPILEDGNFLAYKKVTDNYKDKYTGKFDNSIGAVVTMPRNQVDDNPNNTCSNGLHGASFEYACGFGDGKLIEISVDPVDVVTIPTDYNSQKMRICKYVVLGDASGCERVEQLIQDVYDDEYYHEFYCVRCGETLDEDEELCDNCKL